MQGLDAEGHRVSQGGRATEGPRRSQKVIEYHKGVPQKDSLSHLSPTTESQSLSTPPLDAQLRALAPDGAIAELAVSVEVCASVACFVCFLLVGFRATRAASRRAGGGRSASRRVSTRSVVTPLRAARLVVSSLSPPPPLPMTVVPHAIDRSVARSRAVCRYSARCR